MKLKRDFYSNSALSSAKSFLDKLLVHNSPQGKISGIITDVEAYPMGLDNVSHGNKRTPRTEVLFGPPGHAYVYVIYGKYHQFAIVVNDIDVAEVVFIRGVTPVEGIEIMKANFGREPKNNLEMTKSPGNLCKSFGITKELYGEDLTGNLLYLEDIDIKIPDDKILSSARIGMNPSRKGHDLEYRYFIKDLSLLK